MRRVRLLATHQSALAEAAAGLQLRHGRGFVELKRVGDVGPEAKVTAALGELQTRNPTTIHHSIEHTVRRLTLLACSFCGLPETNESSTSRGVERRVQKRARGTQRLA